MLLRSVTIASAIALLSSTVNAGTSGQIVQIVDSTNFCVFLPPTDSTDRLISDTEWDGKAFCMGKTPDATGAGKLASGFITSAHYVKEDAYVQITGTIDPTKEKLDPTDDGGQYDVKAPTGATCAGWDYFVNLIEPSGNTYCIRCCNDTTNCNRGISEKGCAHIIPGDYSGPSSSSSSSSSSSTTDNSSRTTTEPSSSTDSSSSSKSSSSSSSSDGSSSTSDSSSTGGSSSTSDSSSTDDSSSTGDSTTTSDSSSTADSSTDDSTTSEGSTTDESTTSSPVAVAESSSVQAVPSVASSASSSAANSTPAAASSSTPDVSGTISEQSVNSAGALKPVLITLGAVIAASAAFLA